MQLQNQYAAVPKGNNNYDNLNNHIETVTTSHGLIIETTIK